jgi:2-phosphosulfolactate phosphatase
VVIDVLRASTTIATALFNGAESVIPFAAVEEVFERADRGKRTGVLLCGERNGIRVDGFDLGNSPHEYSMHAVRNKTLLFTSTNGAQVLSAVREAGSVFIAGFINMKALIRAVIQEGKDCILACAGREGGFSLEDSVCAGMAVDELQKRITKNRISLSDEARAVSILYRFHALDLGSMIRESFHGRYLSGLQMDRDLDWCASVDLVDCVPVLSGGRFVAYTLRGPDDDKE